MKYTTKATVLIYTLMLVTISTLMALVILNLSLDLSRSFEIQKIQTNLINTIKIKSNLAMKYAREINASGGGYVDNVSCPQGFNMTGDTQSSLGMNSILVIDENIAYCESTTSHNGGRVAFYFTQDSTDLWYGEYKGGQVSLGSGTLIANFFDSDSTVLDLGSTAYLSADGFDDNFDSDDYKITSSPGVYYPNGYVDNDADARLTTYGYVTEDSGLYNIFWANDRYRLYVDQNTHNTDTVYDKIGSISSGVLHLELDKDYRIVLYRINKSRYNFTSEIYVTETLAGSAQSAGIGYLQNNSDLTLSPTITGNEYVFDFTSHDYALFVENLSGDGLLLYKVTSENLSSGKKAYITPLKDDDPVILSYFGSHMYITDTGQLLGEILEIFGTK